MICLVSDLHFASDEKSKLPKWDQQLLAMIFVDICPHYRLGQVEPSSAPLICYSSLWFTLLILHLHRMTASSLLGGSTIYRIQHQVTSQGCKVLLWPNSLKSSSSSLDVKNKNRNGNLSTVWKMCSDRERKLQHNWT